MIRHIISYYWDESGTDEVTLSTTSYPYSPIIFYFNSCNILFVFWLVESSIICKSHILYMQPYGRSLLLYCWLTKLCDAVRVLSTATVLRDVLLVPKLEGHLARIKILPSVRRYEGTKVTSYEGTFEGTK